MDNIFSNIIDSDIMPGNLTAAFSDHMSQSPIILINLSKFGRENFILDYYFIGWVNLLKIDELNIDNST